MFVYVFLILYILTCVIVNFYFCIRKFVLKKKLKLIGDNTDRMKRHEPGMIGSKDGQNIHRRREA